MHFILRQRESRVHRNIPDRCDPLHHRDEDLLRIYRFPRTVIIDITSSLEDHLERKTKRNKALSPVLQVCVTLNYYASGALFGSLQNAFGLSKPTISRIIHQVSAVLTQLLHEEVALPSDSDMERNARAFFDIARFPNVLGCIDGSHIRIKPPSENEFIYVNRKGYHSINIQCVCDPFMCFIDIVVRYPGSSADAFIFNQCGLKTRLESDDFDGKVLLGDSGYALKHYMLTPFLSPQTDSERSYNYAHKRTRVLIERSFGILKSRFLCLSHKISGPILFSPKRACAVISACIFLHNKARRLNLHIDLQDIDSFDPPDALTPSEVDSNGWNKRSYIASHYFA